MLLGMLRAALWDMSMLQILTLLAKRPRIVYIAATDGRYGGAMAVGDGIDGVGAKQIYLDIKTPLKEWIRQIKEFQPNIIIGYPSAIKILAELVEKGKSGSTCSPGHFLWGTTWSVSPKLSGKELSDRIGQFLWRQRIPDHGGRDESGGWNDSLRRHEPD